MPTDRQAILLIVKLLEQAADDVGVVLPTWVMMRWMDRFEELAAETVNITFTATPGTDPVDQIINDILGTDDTEGS